MGLGGILLSAACACLAPQERSLTAACARAVRSSYHDHARRRGRLHRVYVPLCPLRMPLRVPPASLHAYLSRRPRPALPHTVCCMCALHAWCPDHPSSVPPPQTAPATSTASPPATTTTAPSGCRPRALSTTATVAAPTRTATTASSKQRTLCRDALTAKVMQACCKIIGAR